MKKTTLTMIIAAILAGSVFVGCSANVGTSTGNGIVDTSVVSVNDGAYSEDESQSSTMVSSNQSDNSSESSSSSDESSGQAADDSSQTITNEALPNTSGVLDTSDMFSARDLTQTADLTSAKELAVSDGKTVEVTEEGVYVISGTAKNCTIKINADDTAKVQLVLDGVSITNSSTPAIYVVSADKCFITTTNKENSLTVTGTFTADGTTNTDAVIFSKADLVLNGVGTLNITSTDNGISGKDDIKITGGTYNITSTADAIEANDSIRIYSGTLNIESSKDGLHSENEEDDTKGYIYIADGSFTINAASDAIQGTTAVQLDGGTFDLTAREGVEGTYVQINGGTINITASDDGINASQKSKSYSTPTIEINDGDITIVMGQGDTDAIDVNGNVTVNGGTINITAQTSSFDYDGTAAYNGGTIIINGTQVDSIPQSMMGGGRMGGMNGEMGGMNGGMNGEMGGMNGGFGGRHFY